MNVKHSKIIFSLLVLLGLIFSGCGKTVLFSTWRDRPVKIDGKYTDWSESVAYYDEQTKVVLNLFNDADYLYICLISRNRVIETKIMESGFIIWFNREGDQKKEFGIRFPIGLKRMGMSIDEGDKRSPDRDWQDQEDKSGLIDREKEKLMNKDFNRRLETLESLQTRLEIVRGGRDKPIELSQEEAEKFGIKAKVGRENDYFVYELKVPLTKTAEHVYAIEASKGEPIGLGLETGELSMGVSPGARDDRLPSGGGMSGEEESMFRSANKLKFWFTIALSSPV